MKHNGKTPLALAARIYLYLAIFAVVVIGLIWLFQIVLLNTMYEKSKERELISLSHQATNVIKEYSSLDDITTDKETINDKITSLTNNSDTNFYLISYNEEENKYEVLTEVSRVGFSDLKRMLSSQEGLTDLWNQGKNSASESFKLYLSEEMPPNEAEFDTSVVPNEIEENPDFENIPHLEPSNDKSTEMIYGSFINLNDAQVLIILDTQIMPLSATKATLSVQLIFISIGILVLAFILSLIMSRFIAKPLSDLTTQATNLATNPDDLIFKAKGYKEVETLSKTLNYAQDEIKKSNALQRDFLANVSHELRTPLTLITGYSEMMRDIPDEINSENLNVIISESKRLTILVNDVIALSKYQANVYKLNYEEYDLVSQIRSIVHQFDQYVKENNYRIIINCPEEEIIYADKEKINQVLYNFITNAINYSKETDKIKNIEIDVASENGLVKVSVKDEGIGIKKEDLDKVWNRYYIGNMKQNIKSTGLGLAIVSEILKAHNFSYGVDSVYDEGSTFYFVIDKR